MYSTRSTGSRVLRMRVKDKHAAWLSGLEGATRGGCALQLPVQAVQEIAEEYARRRRQHRKVRLAWRKSGYGLRAFELRAGNFSEDSRGRWYLNVCVQSAQRAGDKPAVGSILDRSVPSVGIDPGLKRFKAIHAKISNRRRDFLHQLSTRLVRGYGAIFVGNVSASALAKTWQAKPVLDAGWSAFRVTAAPAPKAEKVLE